jgi:aryl-phospho-beta-D-glucosidase BglC (GH1 family)
MIKRRSLLALSAAATAACQRSSMTGFSFPSPRLPAGYPERFHTQDAAIVDQRGRKRLFHGVAVPCVLWIAEQNDATIGYFDERLFHTTFEWKANTMRLSVMPAVYRHYGTEAALRALDVSVAFARKYGLYLIITLHAIGYPPDGRYRSLVDWKYGELYQISDAEILRFWEAVARRYRNENAVAFYELINEPVHILPDGSPDYTDDAAPWLGWRDYAERLVDRIRAIDPDKIIIVGGMEFAYDLSHVPQAPVRRPNIVYATHPYAGVDWKRGWQEAFLTTAAAYPVFATEFGWGEGMEESTDKVAGVYHEAILAAFDAAGISWTAWAMSHSFTPSLLAAADFSRATRYGEAVRAALAQRADQT